MSKGGRGRAASSSQILHFLRIQISNSDFLRFTLFHTGLTTSKEC